MVQEIRQREMRDIKFGNTNSKIVSFHKGQNAIHENDREKGSSIIANLNIDTIRQSKTFIKRRVTEQEINLDPSSMHKLGQVTIEEESMYSRTKVVD